MFAADFSMENIACVQAHAMLCACLTVKHVYHAIDHDKHLLSIVDMPNIRLVCPMQTHTGVVEGCNIKRTSSTVGTEIFWMGDGGHVYFPLGKFVNIRFLIILCAL